jgi:flagellar basal-body rod protein FlgB
LKNVLDPIADRIEHYMDLLAARQKVVASNIANVDTPGYKTKDIDFQFEFMSLVKGGMPKINEVSGIASKNDGNNVSMDREARLLAENAIRFNLAANLMKTQLAMVREAIQEKSG